MSFKFKEGDLVEVTKSTAANIGYRFVINKRMVNKHINVYESDVKNDDTSFPQEFLWAKEHNIKLVNPDIDDIADSTFSEIMDEITESITVEQ